MQAIMEPIFDIGYLVSVIVLGVLMLRRGQGAERLFGAMAVTLGAGDSFHLIPRVAALRTTGLAAHAAALGVGRLVTSLTMTAFYVLLYYVWRRRYRVQGRRGLTAAVWLLAAARAALCLLPQNAWTSPNPPLFWGVARNIPFTLLGVLLMVLWFQSAAGGRDKGFGHLWLALAVSFGCYIPVVLFADAVPAVGILMIPKTCAYLWAVLIGYNDMKRRLSVQ